MRFVISNFWSATQPPRRAGRIRTQTLRSGRTPESSLPSLPVMSGTRTSDLFPAAGNAPANDPASTRKSA